MAGLTLVTARRIEDLARRIAEDTREGTGGPLRPEWIAVPGPGLARWLAMRLAEAHGVCSSPTLWFPRKLLVRAMQTASGDTVPERSAFDPESLSWAVAALLPEVSSRPGFEPVARYLEADEDLRLVPLARRIAETLDDYLVYRPDLMLGWEAGGDPHDWQAELWRELLRRHGREHLAARVEAFAERLSEGGPGLGERLPSRVSFFGVHSLPELLWRALKSLAERVEVRVYLPGSDPNFPAAARGEVPGPPPAREPATPAPEDPLAAAALPDAAGPLPGVALGRALGEAGAARIEVPSGSGEDPHAPPGAPGTDLERLQERLIGGPAAGAEAGGEPVPGDASLSFHACAGPLREVQTLHDRILACLDEIPGLDASGIGILTPDPDLYAPLIRSVFEGRDDARRVPTAVASPERDSRAPEAFRAAARVLRGRFAAAEVIDLLDFAPLRERFGLAAEDVAALRERLPEAGVRWGLDAEHREQADQPADPLNTWRTGLDRLLLGWAGAVDAGGEDLGGVAPLETLDDEAGRWLGPLAELLSELAEMRTRFREARSPREWAREIDRAIDRLLAPRGADLDALQALRSAAFDLGEAAWAAGYDEPLPFAALTRELERSSGGAPGTPAQGLFGGGAALAALGSAQGVPFRVLALCGLGADEFPRGDRRPSFDLLREPRAGDPSRREEDRHLFRIALLSARERLILAWPGRDPSDGTERAPSVLVEELLEATAGPGRSPSDLVVRHPLHAHDRDYFRPGRPDERLFSFDDRACEAARAAAVPEPRPRHSPFLPEGWPPEEIEEGDESEPSPGRAAETDAGRELEPEAGPEEEIDLDELDRFFRSPRRHFAQRFLGLTLPREAAAPLEPERVVLDALESWELGEELVSELRGGAAAGAALERLRRAGHLPPGAIGEDVAGEVARAARRIAAGADEGGGSETANLEVRVAGALLRGRIDGLCGDRIVRASYSRAGRPAELSVWLRHLLANAALRGERGPLETRLTTRPPKGNGVRQVRLRAPENPDALLAPLIRLFRQGRDSPLAFWPEEARAYVEALRDEKKGGSEQAALEQARKIRTGEFWRPDPYESLLERGGDGDPLESPEFREGARAVFEPFLEHLEPAGDES